MENMSDALILGFSVLIFVIALTMSMMMFTMARTTSDFVLHKSDKTNYYTYEKFVNQEEVEASKERVVGIEDIVPTIYRYYKEKYRIEFYDQAGNPIILYRSQLTTLPQDINYFDMNDEVARHEPWTANQDFYKKNIDTILSGGEFKYPNGQGKYVYNEGLLNKFKTTKFKEEFITKLTVRQHEKEDEEKIIIKYTVIE